MLFRVGVLSAGPANSVARLLETTKYRGEPRHSVYISSLALAEAQTGVSRVRSGQRQTLGIIRDAR
jgi:allophanate hydrolase subunit 1